MPTCQLQFRTRLQLHLQKWNSTHCLRQWHYFPLFRNPHRILGSAKKILPLHFQLKIQFWKPASIATSRPTNTTSSILCKATSVPTGCRFCILKQRHNDRQVLSVQLFFFGHDRRFWICLHNFFLWTCPHVIWNINFRWFFCRHASCIVERVYVPRGPQFISIYMFVLLK